MAKINKKFDEAKQEYIRQWKSYVNGLYALAFCSDDKASKTVGDCIKKIDALIPKIADTKTSINGVKKEVRA